MSNAEYRLSRLSNNEELFLGIRHSLFDIRNSKPALCQCRCGRALTGGLEDLFGPKQAVRRLQDLPLQPGWIVWMALQEVPDDGCRRGRVVATQRGVQPVLREEDVARRLDLLQQLQAGQDVLPRVAPASDRTRQAPGLGGGER